MYSMAGMCEGSFPECADHYLQAMLYRLIDLAYSVVVVWAYNICYSVDTSGDKPLQTPCSGPSI